VRSERIRLDQGAVDGVGEVPADLHHQLTIVEIHDLEGSATLAFHVFLSSPQLTAVSKYEPHYVRPPRGASGPLSVHIV